MRNDDQPCLRLLYLIFIRLCSWLVLLGRSSTSKNADAGRVRYEPADRAWFAALARLVPRGRWAQVFSVTPGDAAGLAPRAGSEELRHEQAA
jgi:hypothetical protein